MCESCPLVVRVTPKYESKICVDIILSVSCVSFVRLWLEPPVNMRVRYT